MEGLLAHDGDDPAAILNTARTQLLPYPTLRWVQCEVESATRRDEGRFHVRCSDGQEFEGQRLILAYGTVDDLPDIEADYRGVKQVLLNLISNAVKFTPEGGSITLTLRHKVHIKRQNPGDQVNRDRRKSVEIKPAPTGQGVSAEELLP